MSDPVELIVTGMVMTRLEPAGMAVNEVQVMVVVPVQLKLAEELVTVPLRVTPAGKTSVMLIGVLLEPAPRLVTVRV